MNGYKITEWNVLLRTKSDILGDGTKTVSASKEYKITTKAWRESPPCDIRRRNKWSVMWSFRLM